MNAQSSNNHYQINLTHNGGQGEIISNEKPKFLGIHWSGREQKYSFDVNQDDMLDVIDIVILINSAILIHIVILYYYLYVTSSHCYYYL